MCGSWDVYPAILGEEKKSNYGIHKQQDEAECSP